MSIVPTLFLGVEYCATFQAALYIETHSLMHQSEFHAASVALSRAADKRKSLINIHKNGYTATLTKSNCAMERIAVVLHLKSREAGLTVKRFGVSVRRTLAVM